MKVERYPLLGNVVYKETFILFLMGHAWPLDQCYPWMLSFRVDTHVSWLTAADPKPLPIPNLSTA